MGAAEAADDTPFRKRVLAHGAVFSKPTDSGCAAHHAADACHVTRWQRLQVLMGEKTGMQTIRHRHCMQVR